MSAPAPADLRADFGDIDIYLFDQLLRGRIRPGMRVRAISHATPMAGGRQASEARAATRMLSVRASISTGVRVSMFSGR